MSVQRAVAGDYMTTYHRVDGEFINGDFGWVTDLDWFDDLDGPIELVRTTWRCEAQAHVRRSPGMTLCPLCEGEGVVENHSHDLVACPRCLRAGEIHS